MTFKGSPNSIESVMVDEVAPSGAAQGQLQQGDEIVFVDGVTVEGISAERFDFLTTKRAGESVTLTVRAPDGATREVKLVAQRASLGPQP